MTVARADRVGAGVWERAVIANHIHDALSQVRTMQELVLARRRFDGYSGTARMLSGTMALVGAMVLSTARVPATPLAHLIGWGVVLALGIVFNYVALAYWFLFDPRVRRNLVMLRPAIDALPALGVGAALSIGLVVREQFDLLPATWMMLYGLAQVAYRQSLPTAIYGVGVVYVLCGAAMLVLFREIPFTNPWPMGLVFFSGEWAGGIVLYHVHNRGSA